MKNKTDLLMVRSVVILVIISLISLISFIVSLTLGKQNLNISAPGEDTITVSGQAERNVVPNTAKISFSVNEYKKDQKIAADIVNTKTKKIISAIRGLGVKEKNIKTISYIVYPEYDFVKGRREFKGYRVSQSVELKIKNLEKVPSILTRIVELKVDNLNGPNLFVDDIEKIKNSLRKEAIGDAKKKATELGKELGVTLEKIVGFSENNNRYNPFPVYRGAKTSALSYASDNITEPEINLGEEKIIKTINIVFKINE